MASPQAHVITRWLGADVTMARPHVMRFEPPGRGVVLVCSDGLWNYLPDAAGLAALALPAAFHDPASAADVLLKFALEAGGMDNVTIVLAPFPPVRPAVRQAGGARGRGSDHQAHLVGPAVGRLPDRSVVTGESRDYHVGVQVTPAGLGQEMLAARISLVADSASASGGEVPGQGLVRALWTDDESLSTKINSQVAHYTGQAELAAAIQEGLEARKQGDEETATAKLGRAVALAHQSGNGDTSRLLAKVVDVVDVRSGTVRPKQAVDDADEMTLDTRSTKTVPMKK
jgi:hypothetical protein